VNLTALWQDLVEWRARHAGNAQHDLVEQVGAARWEWQAAQHYFQCVSDPNLVDDAVHAMIAAEQKYMSLLRMLKQPQGG
jgi:hypothetical protein